MKRHRDFSFKPIVMLVAAALSSMAVQAADAVADADSLPEISVKAKAANPDALPEAYAGGQVARGGRLGVLGNQDIMDVPFNMTSYTSKTIEDQQARTIADVLINDPSVRTGQAFGTAAQTFVIRGNVLFSDDIGFNGLYGILPRQLPSTEVMERIEVFKGASAFLNGVSPGGSGIGGGVNIVSKRASDSPLSRVTLDYTKDGQLGGHADFGRRFGAANQFGIRINAVQRDGDTAVNHESSRLTLGALGLDFQGEDVRLSADLGYQKQHISQPRLAVGTPNLVFGATQLSSFPKAPSSNKNQSQPWSYTDTEDTFGMVRGEYDFTSHLTGYAALGAKHSNEFNNLSPLTLVSGGSAGDASFFRFTQPYNTNTVSADVGLRGNFQTGDISHQVNLGATSTRITARSDFEASGNLATNIDDPVNYVSPPNSIFGQPTGSLSDPGVRTRTRIKSYALSDTLGFFEDKVLLTLGVRRQSINVINYDYVTGNEEDNSDKTITTPIYGVVYKPWRYLSVYANHIDGLSQGPVAPLTASNPGQSFAAQRSKQNEIGVKADFGNYGAALALYEIKRPYSYQNVFGGEFFNDGKQKTRGIEMNGYGEPVKGLRVLGGAAFTDAELTQADVAANDGNTGIGVPKNQYNLGIEHDISALPGLTLTGRWIRTGEQYADNANTLSIPHWNRYDIGARYLTKLNSHAVVLRANIENLADKNYWASVTPGNGQVMQGLPRVIKVSATFDF